MRIVCLTSNGYVNCIEPFVYYWNKYGGEGHKVLVAHYEEAPTNLPENFEAWEIGKQGDHTWSSGLLRLLMSGRIYDDIILLLLEDYFMSAPTDWARIHELRWWMEQALDVAKIDLSGDRLKVPHSVIGADLVLSNVDTPFQMSVQAALWRKSFLTTYLCASENAWQFEKHGTRRFQAWYEDADVQRYILGTRLPAMQYANAVGGAGHKPGVIEAKHMPVWMADECRAKGWMK